jgi:hypothetical protein
VARPLALTTANLTGHGDAQRLRAPTSLEVFSVLDVTPRYGRAFVESDVAGNAAVVVLSEGLWRRQLGGGPDVVGSTLRLDGRPFTIVGVAPPEVTLPGHADYWRPLVFTPHQLSDNQRGAQWVNAIARLKPGVTHQANSAIAVTANGSRASSPQNEAAHSATPSPGGWCAASARRCWLPGAVSFVLLIACVNVANLLLARAWGARVKSPFAARSAPAAAPRSAVPRGKPRAGIGWRPRLASPSPSRPTHPGGIRTREHPRLVDVGIDWRVLAFTVTTAVANSVLFGCCRRSPRQAPTRHGSQ